MAFGAVRGTLTGGVNDITDPTNATSAGVAVSVGDLVFAAAFVQTGASTTAVTDNLGNTYTPTASVDAGNVTLEGYWSRVTVAGTLTTLAFAATASTFNCVVHGVAFEGPFAESPLDKAPAGLVDALSTALVCPATGTLAQADELVIAVATLNGNAVITADSPNLLAIENNSSTSITGAIGYQVVAETTSVAPAFTVTIASTDDATATFSFMKAADEEPEAGATPARSGFGIRLGIGL
jgi:hypothetical protein